MSSGFFYNNVNSMSAIQGALPAPWSPVGGSDLPINRFFYNNMDLADVFAALPHADYATGPEIGTGLFADYFGQEARDISRFAMLNRMLDIPTNYSFASELNTIYSERPRGEGATGAITTRFGIGPSNADGSLTGMNCGMLNLGYAGTEERLYYGLTKATLPAASFRVRVNVVLGTVNIGPPLNTWHRCNVPIVYSMQNVSWMDICRLSVEIQRYNFDSNQIVEIYPTQFVEMRMGYRGVDDEGGEDEEIEN